ncbi:MAG: RDD family protein [Nocardioides sp.]|nr:RDD family protein [Nocardioides sp.]
MADRDRATLTRDDLVTGEAVALDLPPAGIGSRLVSGMLDVLATLVVLTLLTVLGAWAAARADEALATVVGIGVVVGALVVWSTTFETLTRGRSPGRYALGLRVVRDDAGPISFHHALVRALVGVVEIWTTLATPAFFSMLVSAKGKRLGDYAAGTYVVRTRVPLRLPPPVPMPPALATWARSADVAALPTGLALACRQYLGRAATLAPGARYAVAGRLAEQVGPYVSPAPPPGTHPETFLAAVLATRRERDLARLGERARSRDRLSRRW